MPTEAKNLSTLIEQFHYKMFNMQYVSHPEIKHAPLTDKMAQIIGAVEHQQYVMKTYERKEKLLQDELFAVAQILAAALGYERKINSKIVSDPNQVKTHAEIFEEQRLQEYWTEGKSVEELAREALDVLQATRHFLLDAGYKPERVDPIAQINPKAYAVGE